MTLCFDSVKHKLTQKLGFFDLLGFDFMVDTDFNVSIALFVLACHTTGIREPSSKVLQPRSQAPPVCHTQYVGMLQVCNVAFSHTYTCAHAGVAD